MRAYLVSLPRSATVENPSFSLPSAPRRTSARYIHRPGRETGRLAGAQFPGAAVYALPTRTIRAPGRAAAAGNDPGRLTMKSSASAGRVASAVPDRRRRGR